jgi:hypothetical protein
MRRPHRLIASAVLIAFSGALAGCSSGFGGGFDPTDMLDWLDTKKKLPGERKPVFPAGVPGVEQGIPKDLYKGAQHQDEAMPQAAVAASQPPAEPAPANGKKGKGKPQQAAIAPAAARAAQPPAEQDGEAVPEEDATPAAPPPPKPKKIVRKRTTAPPPDQPAQAAAPQTTQPAQSAQQSQQPFPAPLPGGSFTR